MSHYRQILEQVNQVAQRVGRNPEEITLITVSKNHTPEEIQSVYLEGCRHFGENRVQEALEKMTQLPENIHWHFIGTLQKNKVNQILGKFTLIHSVDSLELAQKISAGSKESTSILLQVNTSGEATKHGLSIEEWKPKLDSLFALPHLKVEGLMTMAPLTEDQKQIRTCFSKLRKFRDQLKLKHLSMGMSHDFNIAIEEGATLLRIGSAIFNKI